MGDFTVTAATGTAETATGPLVISTNVCLSLIIHTTITSTGPEHWKRLTGPYYVLYLPGAGCFFVFFLLFFVHSGSYTNKIAHCKYCRV